MCINSAGLTYSVESGGLVQFGQKLFRDCTERLFTAPQRGYTLAAWDDEKSEEKTASKQATTNKGNIPLVLKYHPKQQ